MFVFMSFSKVPSLMAAKDMDETLSILSKEAEVKQKYLFKIQIFQLNF